MKSIGHLQKIIPTSSQQSQHAEPDVDLLSRVSFPSQQQPMTMSIKNPASKQFYPSTATAISSSNSTSSHRSISHVTPATNHSPTMQLNQAGRTSVPLQSPPQPKPMGLSEIERQLLELKKQTDELRKQLELSQKQNEEYKVRLERLEQEKDREDRCRQYTNSSTNS